MSLVNTSVNSPISRCKLQKIRGKCGDSGIGHVDPSPRYDGDPPLLAVFLWRHLRDPVSPEHVDIFGEGINRPIRLRHGQGRLGSCVLKGGVALHAERDTHGEVLRPGLIRLHGCGIMMKRFPFVRGAVPVKSEKQDCIDGKSPQHFECRILGHQTEVHLPRSLDIHVKVVSDLVEHSLECGTGVLPASLVVGNDVTVPVPQLP